MEKRKFATNAINSKMLVNHIDDASLNLLSTVNQSREVSRGSNNCFLYVIPYHADPTLHRLSSCLSMEVCASELSSMQMMKLLVRHLKTGERCQRWLVAIATVS